MILKGENGTAQSMMGKMMEITSTYIQKHIRRTKEEWEVEFIPEEHWGGSKPLNEILHDEGDIRISRNSKLRNVKHQ